MPEIAAAFVERYGLVVQAGPFEGMRYVDGAAGSSFVPKLVGSYEAELHPILERVLASRYDVVVDIGAAEGYYAVGLALRLPSPLRVYAFDSNRRARGLLKEMARVNGVKDLVVIGGTCSTVDLEACLRTGARALVVSDCEGYELELLRLDVVPALRRAELIVELHDHFAPGTSATVLGRFRATHEVTLVATTRRDANAYPSVAFLDAAQQRVALNEFRNGRQEWAFLTPLQPAGQA